MDFKVTSAATAAVYNAIGVGRENATSRGDLVRRAIEILRYDRPILTADNGKGYYIPLSNDQGRKEAERWVETQNRRCKSIRTAERGAKRFAKQGIKNGQIAGQLSLFGGIGNG